MKIIKSFLCSILILSSVSISTAQNTDDEQELSLNSGSIDSQFEYVFRKSGNFKGTNGQKYEAVKQAWLLRLKANVLDSLKTTYQELDNLEVTVSTQAQKIDDLNSELANTKATLDNTIAEKDSMTLFGMQMSKPNYSLILWSFIGLLSILLLFFIYKFRNSNAITKQARRSLAETEEEFEEHRRVALEREQKVRRQLQDEINKQKKA
ncbi:tRNA (guanine-N1)-methyltransferase [Psychroserpens sp.]|uniref:tRNA (guanine-N1)-methyltransferase n=1 Tax=Psychroserpens sp. TaxID=2020870 RepID=UPI001AFE9C0C|nr:tRNA (guanine-N1)-methyltransferase [Psychroserpens sp.]MBO6606831.1 tRNA (guanine-N1)-methyltransferase [Psychroserpens sp.]MBO6631232.1 tRNA (guanine-N1)-methyltransferase [Psychroserpens sp.]MBO6653534.1 tRNA (guanine-N1)-methyltransferase [Psychroserpens sp.]MBO6680438.1 tRNA (guanine-N1)-methyltransferase [Psychroserpens sp.]MBO6750603.1 tRNA (guanine-N1)-methyltransferase [Psychroserpens sp.]